MASAALHAEVERIAQDALTAAREAGADAAEAFVEHERSVSVVLEGGDVKSAAHVVESAVGIRVLAGERLGHAAGPVNELETIARSAVLAALPAPPGFRFASEADVRVERAAPLPEAERVIADAARMLELGTAPGVKLVGGGLGWGSVVTVLATTDEYLHVQADTMGGCGMSCVAEADHPGAAGASTWAREAPLDLEGVAKEAVEHALATRDPVALHGPVERIVFHPRALSGLLASTLLAALDGAAQARRESPFVTTRGAVADAEVRVAELGADASTPMLATRDDEGRPFQRLDYVADGEAIAAVATREDAAEHGLDVAGWSWRSAPLSGRSAHGRPLAAPGNLLVDAPRASSDELMAEAAGALFVIDLLGAHTANPTTGRFAVEATTAYRVAADGQLTAVQGALISGTLVELLRGLRLSTTPEPRPSWDAPGLLLGHTLVEGLKVTGRKPEGPSTRSGNP